MVKNNISTNKEVRYITKGLIEVNKMNPVLYLRLWDLYDEMQVEKDYLQIFNLKAEITNKGILQIIEHSQEEPKFAQLHKYYTDRPIENKIYIVKEGDNSVMMLASEY